jgi:hypothetical protein
MSALIGVCASDRVHIVTDGITLRPDSGIVAAIIHKFGVLKNGAAVAGIGIWGVSERFCQLADARGINFDELVTTAPELWKEARADILRDDYKDARCCAIFAGWSDRCSRPQLHLILSTGELYADVVAFAAGPTGSCAELVAPFVTRFRADPDSFDARRDGVEMMKQMRAHHPKKFGETQRPSVGGHVEHIVVTRDGVAAEIIHRWPSDRVGKTIELDDAGSTPHAGPLKNDAVEYVNEDGEVVWKDGVLRLRRLPNEVIEGIKRTDPDLAAKYEIQRPVIGGGLPTAEELDWLRRNPSRAHLFDKDFWVGAAAHYLRDNELPVA